MTGQFFICCSRNKEGKEAQLDHQKSRLPTLFRVGSTHITFQGCPCGFSQSLWLTNCLVNFSFFWSAKSKLFRLRDRTIFCPVFFENWSLSCILTGQKNQERGHKKVVQSLRQVMDVPKVFYLIKFLAISTARVHNISA